jgi:hypothetical protein
VSAPGRARNNQLTANYYNENRNHCRNDQSPIHVSLVPDSLIGLPNNLLIRAPNPVKNSSPTSSKRYCIPRGSALLERAKANLKRIPLELPRRFALLGMALSPDSAGRSPELYFSRPSTAWRAPSDYNINHITITPSRHRHIPRENTALA